MVSRFLRRPGDLTVELDKRAYRPGERIEATVRLNCDRDLAIEEGCVELIGRAQCTTRVLHVSMGTGRGAGGGGVPRERVRRVTVTVPLLSTRSVFASQSTISGGMPQTHKVAFDIPADIPPTYEGHIVKVKYLIKAVCDVRRSRDIEGETEVIVLPFLSSSSPEAEAKVASTSNNDCTLSLSLPKTLIAQGETVSAVLRVEPHRDFGVNEVRVELCCDERVPGRGSSDLGNSHTATEETVAVAGGTEFQAGLARTFPFQFTVPSGCKPRVVTSSFTAGGWRIRGVLARRMRSDYEVGHLLDVYGTESARHEREKERRV